MENTNKTISEKFSGGDFAFCYPFFADDITWEIVGNKVVTGKAQVVSFCNEMMIEIASSNLINTNVVASAENIAIEGYCNYADADNNPRKVSYCDVYRFKEDKLYSITSYCIDKKL